MKNSPVQILLEKLITFDKSLPQPVYIQIAQQIINAIQRRYLVKGMLLPGTRVLAKSLHIHRNTAVAVYDELASQGWVEILPNKGTFVLEPHQKKTKIKASSERLTIPYQYANSTGFSFQSSFHLAPTQETIQTKYSINDGKPDLRLHPMHQFTRWYSAAMNRKTLITKWNNPTGFSFALFKQQLCNYLNLTRGFHITPNHILSTRSTEMSLYIVSQLLLKPKDVVLVGQLSNYATNMTFQQVGASIKTIPVDKDGIEVNYIKNHFKKGSIRAVYITANRDYPTMVTLSVQRRLALLALAKVYEFAIIEDDYDYDFQFEGSSMLPMATADEEGLVIYLGKLGQSLFPSFQTGFVIAPKNFISEANNYLQLLDKQGDLIQKQMLSELIHEGEIYRLTKKNSVLYKRRQDHLKHLLEKHFSNVASWQIPTGGLAIWLAFYPKISLVEYAKICEAYNLLLPKTVLYQDKNTCAIRLGYAHLNTEELTNVIAIMKRAYKKVTQNKDKI